MIVLRSYLWDVSICKDFVRTPLSERGCQDPVRAAVCWKKHLQSMLRGNGGLHNLSALRVFWNSRKHQEIGRTRSGRSVEWNPMRGEVSRRWSGAGC